jgi:site-specific DNA-methyltransferase (adenine-specific)
MNFDGLNLICGDCVNIMPRLKPGCADFILTDPPYITRFRPYKNNAGQSVANDDNVQWLEPAFRAMYRLLKTDGFAVSFYGWSKADLFLRAWRRAGFGIGGHFAFRKPYASKSAYVEYRHETAYLLIKGNPAFPANPVPDVLDWTYTGNVLHPTQKPVGILRPLIEGFTKPGDTVLDPFCGSGSTPAAAYLTDREYIGIELDPQHFSTASRRMTALRNERRAA